MTFLLICFRKTNFLFDYLISLEYISQFLFNNYFNFLFPLVQNAADLVSFYTKMLLIIQAVT